MTATAGRVPDFDDSGDPLGEVLHLLRLSGSLYCRGELTHPWGVQVEDLDGLMVFIVVTSGRARLEIEGQPTRVLEPGTLTLIPRGIAHALRSDSCAPLTPLTEIPVERVSERYEIMRYGGGGELTQSTYGVMHFDHVSAERLLDALPPVVQIDSWEDESGWLQSTLRLIAREARALRPGGETVITRLADVLVIQAIRSWLDTSPEAQVGWFAALRDPRIGRSLAAIHRSPEREWTVATLAQVAGLSRSGFSARFSELVGDSPLSYLTDWRMVSARQRLVRSPDPLSSIALEVGYQSEAAFSRAFKKRFGVSPGRARRGPQERRDAELFSSPLNSRSPLVAPQMNSLGR